MLFKSVLPLSKTNLVELVRSMETNNITHGSSLSLIWKITRTKVERILFPLKQENVGIIYICFATKRIKY